MPFISNETYAVKLSGDTIYSGGTDLSLLFATSSQVTNNTNLINTRVIRSGDTMTGQLTTTALSATTLSGGTIFSGNTNLENIFVTSGTSIGTGGAVFKSKIGNITQFRSIVQGANITVTENANDITIASTASGGGGSVNNGTNTFTAGTNTFQSVNVTALTIDNIIASATSRFSILSATTISADTIYFPRIIIRTGTTTSSATPTINTDNIDIYTITALAVDITSFTSNLAGSPREGQKLWIAITGTATRAITWGASFEASTVALPTSTISTNRLDVGFVWNTITNKWRCVAVC